MKYRRMNTILKILCYFLVFSCFSKQLTAQNEFNDSSLIASTNYLDSNSILSIRTERIDPLGNFKKYTGGYNITDKHYWSSIIFTGKYGYIIAAVWIFCGISLVTFHVITNIYLSNKLEKTQINALRFCSQRVDLWFILSSILFVILAIVVSTIALTGSVGFHSRAESIKRIISRTASDASETLFNITKAIKSMQNITNEGVEKSTNLNLTAQSLNEESIDIQRKGEKSMMNVNGGINILEAVTITVIVVNLVAVLALLGTRPLKSNRLSSAIVILCWMCTFLFWIYFGLYFFLAEFSADTCIALDEYQLNPENSSLGSILPCNDKANKILQDVGIVIYNLIDQVNGKIFTIRSSEVADLQYVCNPFSGRPDYFYQPDNCSSSTINIGDIPLALRRYACLENEETTCPQSKYKISTSEYDKIQIYTNTIQTIINVFPSTERLLNCQLVKDSFSEILLNQCKPLKKYAHLTWASMLILSIIMVLLIMIQITEKIHDEKYHEIDGLVNPHSSFIGELIGVRTIGKI